MLQPEHWPACWMVVNREGGTHLGARTTREGEALVYACTCGSMFSRRAGFLIDEARAWVTEHAPHVDAMP